MSWFLFSQPPQPPQPPQSLQLPQIPEETINDIVARIQESNKELVERGARETAEATLRGVRAADETNGEAVVVVQPTPPPPSVRHRCTQWATRQLKKFNRSCGERAVGLGFVVQFAVVTGFVAYNAPSTWSKAAVIEMGLFAVVNFYIACKKSSGDRAHATAVEEATRSEIADLDEAPEAAEP